MKHLTSSEKPDGASAGSNKKPNRGKRSAIRRLAGKRNNMGQYHYLVNITKKEFVHPHQIGNGLKIREQVQWDYSTSTALMMLLAASCKGGPRGGGDFHSEHPLVGSWAGDQIAFIGDYAEESDLPDNSGKAIADAVMGENPDPAWTNISPDVRAMMSSEFGIRYKGDGWLDIEDGDVKATPAMTPDMIFTAA